LTPAADTVSVRKQTKRRRYHAQAGVVRLIADNAEHALNIATTITAAKAINGESLDISITQYVGE
jgi:hypothetical protein